MHSHNDDWIENRILRTLGKRNLPDGRTVFGHDSFHTLPPGMRVVTESGNVGRPVVVFVGGEQLWTLLGTDGLYSQDQDQVFHLKLDDIRDLSLIDATGIPRQACARIDATDRYGGKHTIWGPPGEGCLALCAALQILLRLQIQNEEREQ